MRIALRSASSAARTIRLAAAIAAAAAAIAAAQDSETADEALKKGDLAEAKAQFGQDAKRNPADYNSLLNYASTLPPKEALKIADSLSRAQNTPGWAKARGLRFSGDRHFLKEDYKKAADAYLQASLLDSGASTYKHLYALSIAMDGRTEAARVIWNDLALDKTNELSGEATRLLALMPKPAAPEAAAAPVNSVKIDTVKTPSTPAAPPTPPVAPVNQTNNTPVSTTVNPVKADTVKTPSTPAAPPPPPAAPANPKPTGPVFTIQVGAFASKENADNLVRRLTGKYEDISISTTGSVDLTLYRVRVGTFYKKEDAVAFADKLIIEAGLSARVTEK